jgi:hypothetical protein
MQIIRNPKQKQFKRIQTVITKKMADENYEGQYFLEMNTRIKDIEEKQRIIKDRLLITGSNLIDTRNDTHTEIINLKKEIENLKKDSERMKSFIESLSDEISKFARKEDLEILTKQAKMFQPLELVTKRDLEKLKNN